ncbi:MAG TPA: DUF3078 domain-containing protein [Ignavibacteria bacterium]|nr:DUF3078 domain-containing protein [Ignavibacteria bacterium]HRK00395.1 DUF3078 domain-containing protein [Ignavibacteria bacterium]
MIRIYIFIFSAVIFLMSGLTFSQQDTTLKPGWNPKGVLGLGISQVALSNWSKGGENLLSITGISDFSNHLLSKPWILKNNLKVTLGSTKTGSNSFQTNDNDLRLENVLIYDAGWLFNPYVSNEIRTSILNGFDYTLDPAVQISAFFDPGYVTQSLGFTYGNPNFSTRLGFAFQETFTNKFRQFTDDLETPDKTEAFKFQTGVESVTESNFTVAHNLLYTGRLRLFSAFETFDVWDVGFDNTFTAVVNDFLNVNLNVLVVYEKAQSLKTQLKEGLQVGITYTVF